MSLAPRVLRVPRPSRVSAYFAARLGPLTIDPWVVRDVLERFDLEMQQTPRNLRLTRRSLNAAVMTTRGRKVVKLYRPEWTPSTVAYGHAILRRLETLDFPAVRVERTRSDETWTVIDDGVFAVFDFVWGTNYSLNYLLRPQRLRLTTIAGCTLAEMHRTLRSFEPVGTHHLGFASMTGMRHRDVSWHAAKINELITLSTALDAPEASATSRVLIDNATQTLDEIERLDAKLSAVGLPRLVIHGDYGLHNLLYQRTHAVPVDFEVSRLDWRVNDLVSALGKYRYRGGLYDFESMRTFVEAYASVFPLTADEERLFPDVWRLYKLQAAVQYWNSYFETNGPVRKLASAVDSIEQADWVVSNHGTVTDLVRNSNGRHVR